MTETENPIRDESDTLLKVIHEKTGVSLDYSLTTALILDGLLLNIFGKGMVRIKPEMENLKKGLTFQIGCLYGECMRETFSGRWAQDAQGHLALTRVGNLDITIFPMNAAEERINGDDTKIFAAATSLSHHVFEAIDKSLYSGSEQ